MKVRLLAKHYVRPDAPVGSVHDVSEDVATRLVERGLAEQVTRSPDESWTVRDLRAYASEHDLDLGDATKKADILAAIQAG